MADIATYTGDIYLAEVNSAGVITGNWEFAGEAHPLSIQTSDTVTTVKGRTNSTGGKTVASKTQADDATGSLSLHEYTTTSIAKALKALVTTKAVAAQTFTDKTVTLGNIGEFVEIGGEDLTEVSVTDSEATALVSGTDYRIDVNLGLIAPLTSALEEATVKVTAVSAADTTERLTIGEGSAGKYAIKGYLINEYDTSNAVKVYLRKVLLSSNNEINLVSEDGADHEQVDFTLTPEIPTGCSDYGTIDGLPIA